MSDESVSDVKLDSQPLDQLIGEEAMKVISRQLLSNRKVVGDDNAVYEDVEHVHDGVTYIIHGTHITFDEATRHAKSSCKKCNGMGRYILHIEKRRIQHPEDFIVLANRSLDGITEEQKSQIIEEEKKNPFWRVALPCKCTIKNLIKKHGIVLGNDLGNILLRVTYDIKE